MCQYIFGQSAYDLFNNIGIYVALISVFFLIKTKTKAMGLYSRYAIFYVSKKSLRAKKFLEYFLAFIELFCLTILSIIVALLNHSFGDLVGTGGNYFASLFIFPILGAIFSILIKANPLKQIDIVTLLMPVRLFFTKIACYCQGCCWGISWEYGPYNHHYDHPGNQVPVQLIEALLILLIFVFLLWYRKKANKGTMFPVYLILYSGTRFFSEFFAAAYSDVLGPFNMYQLLCFAGVIIGFIMLLIVKIFSEKITEHFEKPHRKLDLKIAQHEEQKALDPT